MEQVIEMSKAELAEFDALEIKKNRTPEEEKRYEELWQKFLEDFGYPHEGE